MLQMKVSTFVKAIGIPALSEIRWSNNMLPSGIQGLGMGLPDLRSKNKRKQKAAPKESHASETLNKLIEQTRETVKGLESIAGLKASSVDGLGLRDDKMMEDLVKQFEELAKSQVSPAEVIFDSQGLTKEAQKALNKYSLIGSVATQMTPTQPATDFVDSFEVHNFIKMKGYFKGSSNVWDHVLDGVVHQEIALCALGGLTNHLSRLKLDDTLLNGSILPYEVYRGCLRMDGQTMANLEIFSNSEDGGTSGTLYKYLDNCLTLSGKRLLRKWLCHPLKDIEEINQRLNVVEELMGHADIMQLIAQHLKKLPDLERFLGQIKATCNSTALLLLPLIGGKILKQRVKAFGFLVKGLRVGMHLLMLLQKEDNVFSLLSKLFTLPMLSGSDGLDKFLTQFEAAVDSDFTYYQAHELKDSDVEILSILIELFMEKANRGRLSAEL